MKTQRKVEKGCSITEKTLKSTFVRAAATAVLAMYCTKVPSRGACLTSETAKICLFIETIFQ